MWGSGLKVGPAGSVGYATYGLVSYRFFLCPAEGKREHLVITVIWIEAYAGNMQLLEEQKGS